MSALAHVLCGTCVGEYERCRGYFESKRRREAVLSVEKFEIGTRAFCCNCGQDDFIAATFQLKVGSELCDGNHETPDKDG